MRLGPPGSGQKVGGGFTRAAGTGAARSCLSHAGGPLPLGAHTASRRRPSWGPEKGRDLTAARLADLSLPGFGWIFSPWDASGSSRWQVNHFHISFDFRSKDICISMLLWFNLACCGNFTLIKEGNFYWESNNFTFVIVVALRSL